MKVKYQSNGIRREDVVKVEHLAARHKVMHRQMGKSCVNDKARGSHG